MAEAALHDLLMYVSMYVRMYVYAHGFGKHHALQCNMIQVDITHSQLMLRLQGVVAAMCDWVELARYSGDDWGFPATDCDPFGRIPGASGLHQGMVLRRLFCTTAAYMDSQQEWQIFARHALPVFLLNFSITLEVTVMYFETAFQKWLEADLAVKQGLEILSKAGKSMYVVYCPCLLCIPRKPCSRCDMHCMPFMFYSALHAHESVADTFGSSGEVHLPATMQYLVHVGAGHRSACTAIYLAVVMLQCVSRPVISSLDSTCWIPDLQPILAAST